MSRELLAYASRLFGAIDRIFLPTTTSRQHSAGAPAASKPKPAEPPRPEPLRYASSCRFQGRGIEPLDVKLRSAGLADLCSLIEERLRTHGRCKVLEVGCGEGRLLLELLDKFERRVELHGLNHPDWPQIAGSSPLHRTNENYRILSDERLLALPLPALHAADVQDLGAFPLRDFDLIVSQAVIPHVPDKARALEQCANLLAPDGMFVHELDCCDLPPLDFLASDLPRLTIYSDGCRVSARQHLRLAGLELLECRRVGGQGHGVLAVYRARAQPLRLGLALDRESTLQLSSITACDVRLRLWGARSVYHAVQGDAQ